MLKNKQIGFFIGLLPIFGFGASFFLQYQKKDYHLAVIPHFMIMPERVSDFYAFSKSEYYPSGKLPQTIVLLSPNHFFPSQKNVEGLCKTEKIKFNNETIIGFSLDDEKITCGGKVFYLKGDQKYTKDHGLGEHFRWINQYFPSVKKVIPLALPSHDMSNVERLVEKIKHLPGRVFVIASVDFSHYLSEEIAVKNDQISFATLQKTGAFNHLRSLDVDCPACLGVVYRLAEEKELKVQQWLRDSSSTIVGKDLKEENTSRQFFWRK